MTTANELLVDLARQGARRRYGTPLPPAVEERLDYELGVITKTGYAGYFLIVADFISGRARARHPGRAGPRLGGRLARRVRARGSPTSDPLRFDLLFERFLNPERVSMPDIDVDFCFERRGEVIEYVRAEVRPGVGRARSSRSGR